MTWQQIGSAALSIVAELEEKQRRAFIRECERDGIDPKRGVSPALVKLVQEQNGAQHG